jgi:hypothetical protein
MDLTRLYNLTTPELRKEAERIGVGDTYAMSRGQLIHAIRHQASGPPQEGLIGKVLGFAKWALQAAQEEPRKEGSSHPPPDVAPQKEEAKRFSRPSDATDSAPVPLPVSVPAPAPVPASPPAQESASVTATPTESIDSFADGPTTSSGPPSRPPAGVFSKSAGMFEEPFPTRTMARILADQGHFKRALAIYAALMRNEPSDTELRAEAAEVRTRSRVRRSQVH